MKLLDYLFFRVYSFYKKRKDSTPILMGCLVLSLLMCFSILSIIVLMSVFFNLSFDYMLKPMMFLLLILIPIFFGYRYTRNDYPNKLVDRYKNEKSSNKHIRGWLFIFYLLLVIAIPISVGYMRHNLGMDI